MKYIYKIIIFFSVLYCFAFTINAIETPYIADSNNFHKVTNITNITEDKVKGLLNDKKSSGSKSILDTIDCINDGNLENLSKIFSSSNIDVKLDYDNNNSKIGKAVVISTNNYNVSGIEYDNSYLNRLINAYGNINFAIRNNDPSNPGEDSRNFYATNPLYLQMIIRTTKGQKAETLNDFEFLLRTYFYTTRDGLNGPVANELYISDIDITDSIIKSVGTNSDITTIINKQGPSTIIEYLFANVEVGSASEGEDDNLPVDFNDVKDALEDTLNTRSEGLSNLDDRFKEIFSILGNYESNKDDLTGYIKESNNDKIQTLINIYLILLKKSKIFDESFSDFDPLSYNEKTIAKSALPGTADDVEGFWKKYSEYESKLLESNVRIPSDWSEKISAMYFNDITYYRLALISGMTEVGSNAEIETGAFTKNENLNSLVNENISARGKIIDPNLINALREAHIPFNESHGLTYKEYLGLVHSLLSIQSYAQNTVNSGLSNGSEGNDGENTSTTWINNSLDLYLESEQTEDLDSTDSNEDEDECDNSNDETDNDGESEEDEGSSEVSALKDPLRSQIIAYKSIHDGLDLLGITPWCPELRAIYDYYDEIKDIANKIEQDMYTEDDAYPLSRFFDYNEKILSADYIAGVAESATYVPMQTNLYDVTSIRVLKNEDWVSKFHVKWGFHRKALMIDTNINSAVDLYISNTKGSLRPATLNDLLQPEKDIVLYVDDNFYNTDEVAELTNRAYDRLINTEEATNGGKGDSGRDLSRDLFNVSIEEILKTGPKYTYSDTYIKGTVSYGEDPVWYKPSTWIENLITDSVIMSAGKSTDPSSNTIKQALDQPDYTPKQSYAVVSGIYRHKDLVRNLNDIARNAQPVFISSNTLFNVNGVSEYYFNSIYNYYMLKNMEAVVGVDYRTTLDIDNPIYIDIYGNIVSESGLVIIPAASNPTLYKDNLYTPYNLGFMYYYSKGTNITETNENMEKYMLDFTWDADHKNFLQKDYVINDVAMYPQNPSIMNDEFLSVLYDMQIDLFDNQYCYNFDQRIWLMTEVLRGAPVESIDKVKEGLSGKRDISKYGLYTSWKLDELADLLLPSSNGNSIISMPNIGFLPGVEYIILFLFKLLMLLFVAFIMYKIYIDAVGGTLGLRTLWQTVSTIAIFTLALALVPDIIKLSYNETNKLLLQDEISYINMLNTEKRLEGREVSAVDVTEPSTQSKFYIKVEDLSIPWYELLYKVMFTPIDVSLSDLYDKELEDNMISGYAGVEIIEDGAYISTDTIFDSTSIDYSPDYRILQQTVLQSPTASYYLPYYYITDNFLMKLNDFNTRQGLINISTKVLSNGSVKTIGMIKDYMLSEKFLIDEVDPLGLYSLYGINTNRVNSSILMMNSDAEDAFKSLWCMYEQYDIEDIASMIDQVYSHMRSFVVKNRRMLGRITDETFIKTVMLDTSIYYNNVFRVPSARGIEIFNIDSRDLIRRTLADESTTIISSPESFGRFSYMQAGGLGVVLMAVLLGLYFITSVIRPFFVIFLCVLLVYNLLIKNIIGMHKGKTIEGLIYIVSILVIINTIFAMLMKFSMFLPRMGITGTVSIIVQILLQVIYLVISIKVVQVILADITNFGYNVLNATVLVITGSVVASLANKFSSPQYSKEQQTSMSEAKMKNENSGKKAKELREEMEERDKQRNEEDESNAFINYVYNRAEA